MKVTLKDGSIKEYSGAKTVYELPVTSAKDWEERPAREKWTEKS